MYGYIYLIENMINNKKYIGKHVSSVFEPERYIGSGKIFLEAVEKYGKDNFKCSLIEECFSEKELNEREIYWINFYNAVESDNFYNLSYGGNGGDLSKYIDYSKCTKVGSDNWNFGKHYKWYNDGEKEIKIFTGQIIEDNYVEGRLCVLSDESRRKISISRLGKSPANKGVPMAEEQRKKVSESRKGKCCGDDNPSRREDVRLKLSKKYICPYCKDYINTKACITRHIRKIHKNSIESASTIESVDWEKYSIE